METMERKRLRPGRFKGGLQLAGHKEVSTREPIRTAPPPERAIVPLQQHLGEPAAFNVKVGDRVVRGQPITRTDHYVAAELHAPISGRVTAIEDHPVPAMSSVANPCAVIETDGTERRYAGYQPMTSSKGVPVAKVVERVRTGGVVGLGGAVFPSHVKLTVPPAHPLEALILNGAESEPYITADEILVRERASEIVSGAQVIMYALGVNRCLVAIANDKPHALEAMSTALDAERDDRFDLIGVDAIYPVGAERQLIKVLVGREVPSSGLPPDIGYVCHNVGTAFAVKRAVIDGEPLIERIVTVTGPGVRKPGNLVVRLGTLVSDLIEQCGGYADDVEMLVMGGPLTGVALETDAVPVVKATNCILALTRSELSSGDDARPCIRCGACAQACPAQLLPQQLHYHARVGQLDRVLDHDLFDCIECGCCDLVCPSHIALTQSFLNAKASVWARERRRRKWFASAEAAAMTEPARKD